MKNTVFFQNVKKHGPWCDPCNRDFQLTLIICFEIKDGAFNGDTFLNYINEKLSKHFIKSYSGFSSHG